MARPKLPPEKLHDEQVNVRLTRREKVLSQAIADYHDIPLQTLLRSYIVEAIDSWELIHSKETVAKRVHQ